MSQHNLPITATTDLDSVKNHFKIWRETGLVNLILYRLINMLVRNLRFSCRFPLK